MNKQWERIERGDPLTGVVTGVEIVPVNDLAPHPSSLQCACCPVLKTSDDHPPMLIHNSYDGREFAEKGHQERGN